jgi:hypothetical protein
MFYIPSFKIYGSVAGFYDYGPPGCAIKQNVTQVRRLPCWLPCRQRPGAATGQGQQRQAAALQGSSVAPLLGHWPGAGGAARPPAAWPTPGTRSGAARAGREPPARPPARPRRRPGASTLCWRKTCSRWSALR